MSRDYFSHTQGLGALLCTCRRYIRERKTTRCDQFGGDPNGMVPVKISGHFDGIQGVFMREKLFDNNIIVEIWDTSSWRPIRFDRQSSSRFCSGKTWPNVDANQTLLQ
ncbi:unnamed protein product [Sphacelaria rigidula]